MVLAVKAQGLKIGFLDIGEKPVWVVKGVSFDVNQGELYCLVGESGSGKTTIAKAVTGILPPHATTRGILEVFGKRVIENEKWDFSGVRGRLATYIPQNPGTGLSPYFTVFDQFYMVLNSLYGLDKNKTREIATKYLKLVGLDPAYIIEEEMYPHELSGGMVQRAAIALALATGAKLIVADEPTSSLDANLRLQMLTLFIKLKKELGLSIILITHDLLGASRVCDRIAVIYAGMILEEGAGPSVSTKPLHPYTTMLLDSAPVLGELKPLRSISGEPPPPGFETEDCIYKMRCDVAFDKCVKQPPLVGVDDRKVACWRYLTNGE